jgi:hypothetical protein
MFTFIILTAVTVALVATIMDDNRRIENTARSLIRIK